MTLSDEQVTDVAVASIVVSAFSLFGSAFIIACYFGYKHLRSFAFTLVVFLSFNDFFNQISAFVQPSAADLRDMEDKGYVTPLCTCQAVLTSFFELSSVLWTTSIAATLYMTVFLKMSAARVQKHFKWMLLICQGIPFLFTVIPGSLGFYGPAGAWCWVTEEHPAWRWIQFFVPLWIAIIFNSVVYIAVIRRIKSQYRATQAVDEQSANAMLSIVRRLRFYPLILIVVWLIPTINRIVEESMDRQIFTLFILQKIFSSMQGFLNAFAYGFSAGVREALRETASRQCSCLVRDIYSQELIGTPLSSRSKQSKKRTPSKYRMNSTNTITTTDTLKAVHIPQEEYGRVPTQSDAGLDAGLDGGDIAHRGSLSADDGWTTSITISQSQKKGSSNDQINTLDGQTNTLDGHTNTLDGQINTLDGQTNTLDGHTNTLDGQINTLNTTQVRHASMTAPRSDSINSSSPHMITSPLSGQENTVTSNPLAFNESVSNGINNTDTRENRVKRMQDDSPT